MEKLLLTYNDIKSVNIGDYTQSLAAKQFIGKDYNLCNRDELGIYSGNNAKVILNGWFTYKPQNWPPASGIDPLFVAFHINDSCKSHLTSENSIKYLKRYEPIGCRDYGTAEVLSKKGVDAYFSGCLTTTLGQTYKNAGNKSDDIYIVDPLAYLPNGKGPIQIVKSLFNYMIHFRSVNKIVQNLKRNNSFSIRFSKIGLTRILLIPNWYLVLRNIVDEEVLHNAKFITQFHEKEEYPTDIERFDRASDLLKMYANAKYVITSRIHCALPCLGLETPVVFIRNMSEDEKSTCRFKGIENLFNEIHIKGHRVVKNFYKSKLTSKAIFSNSNDYKVYADRLMKKCKEFMSY